METSPASSASFTEKEQSLCADCTFLDWGTWDAHIVYGKGKDTTNLKVDHGWWVAGDTTSVGDLDKLFALGATATYQGTAWGTVYDGGEPREASGDLTMNWNFAPRAGDLTISNFEGRTYATLPNALTQPNPALNRFDGVLQQTAGPSIDNLTGKATGSFVNNGSVAAGGVIGNWNVGGSNYKATGIFGGAGTPRLPGH